LGKNHFRGGGWSCVNSEGGGVVRGIYFYSRPPRYFDGGVGNRISVNFAHIWQKCRITLIMRNAYRENTMT